MKESILELLEELQFAITSKDLLKVTELLRALKEILLSEYSG